MGVYQVLVGPNAYPLLFFWLLFLSTRVSVLIVYEIKKLKWMYILLQAIVLLLLCLNFTVARDFKPVSSTECQTPVTFPHRSIVVIYTTLCPIAFSLADFKRI